MTKEKWLEISQHPDIFSFEAAFEYWKDIKPPEYRDYEYEEFVKRFVEFTNIQAPVLAPDGRVTIFNIESAHIRIKEHYDRKFNISPVPDTPSDTGGDLFTGEPEQQSGTEQVSQVEGN